MANELLEAVIAADLTARQLKVVLAVMRKTYGFGRVLDRISNVQIAEETGIHHTHICKAKNELIAMNVLVSSGNQLGINKVVSDWKTGISQNSKTLAKTANKSLAESANTTSNERLANLANKTLADSANKTLANSAKHKRNKNKIYITPLTPQGGKAKFNPLEADLPDWLDPAKVDDSLTAALCVDCHHAIDNGSELTREERRALMDRAIVLTLRELTRRGLVVPK
ncbi:replication protein [Cronobacter dublinensis]|uniref:replication protein n=1 Tax=Cronobacter dublinensis TaxID=413497 RepID=UPI00387DC1B4